MGIRIPEELDLLEKIQAVPEESEKEYGEVDSHLLIERDKQGRPAHAGYTYVDEQTCVGCYNCAMVAPATFFMERLTARRASSTSTATPRRSSRRPSTRAPSTASTP